MKIIEISKEKAVRDRGISSIYEKICNDVVDLGKSLEITVDDIRQGNNMVVCIHARLKTKGVREQISLSRKGLKVTIYRKD